MTDQPNESSAEVTERELLVQTLRLQEQALSQISLNWLSVENN